jgi:hypothetical protein
MHGYVLKQQRKLAKTHVQVTHDGNTYIGYTCDCERVSPCATQLLDGLL